MKSILGRMGRLLAGILAVAMIMTTVSQDMMTVFAMEPSETELSESGDAAQSELGGGGESLGGRARR